MEQFTLWTNIVLSLIGSGILGLLGTAIMTIRYRRQEKAQKDSDAITASTNTVESVANAADSAADRYEAAMGKRLEVMQKYYDILDDNMELKSRIRFLESRLKVSEYQGSENSRKILGLQKKLDEMIARTTYAEKNICFDKDCPIREPKRGTYNGEKKESQEIQTEKGNESIA
jgi:hypothetical protein